MSNQKTIDYLPTGSAYARYTDGALVANWINCIFARLNPWAAVTFSEITGSAIYFRSGARDYVLRFQPFAVREIVGAASEGIPTPAAERVAQELDGWRRDDDGNRNPPPGYFPRRPNDDPRPTPPGDWETLCENARRAADASKPIRLAAELEAAITSGYRPNLVWAGWQSKPQPSAAPKNGPLVAGVWRPIETAPPNTRVSIIIEGGRSYTGWLDSADGHWRAIHPWNERPDIICGLNPIGWLPL